MMILDDKSWSEIEKKLTDDAAGGSIPAAKQLSEILNDRDFRLKKEDIFGGAEDPDLYAEIQKYIESGCPGSLSDNEQLKLQLLQMVYAFDVKHGDRKTMRFLTRPPYNLGYDRARDILSQAIELFSPARDVSKDAMRHHTADAYDTIYHAILASAKTPQDYALAAGILDKKVKLLRLDQPDIPMLESQAYRRPWMVFSLDPGVLGLPPSNRDVLGEQIDSLEIPGVEKKRLRMESRLDDVDIVKMLENIKEG